MFWIIYCAIFPVAFVAMYKVWIKMDRMVFGSSTIISTEDRIVYSLLSLLMAALWPITAPVVLFIALVVFACIKSGGKVSKFYDWMEK